MLKNLYNKLIISLQKFIGNTDNSNSDSVKRSANYLEWCEIKTDIVDKENSFSLTHEQQNLIKRGNVLWVNFGFNIGCEFGLPFCIIKRIENVLLSIGANFCVMSVLVAFVYC